MGYYKVEVESKNNEINRKYPQKFWVKNMRTIIKILKECRKAGRNFEMEIEYIK